MARAREKKEQGKAKANGVRAAASGAKPYWWLPIVVALVPILWRAGPRWVRAALRRGLPAEEPRCIGMSSADANRTIACMELCYGPRSPLLEADIAHVSAESLGTCLSGDDVGRRLCAQLDEIVSRCVAVCRAGEHKYVKKYLPCATHPALESLAASEITCSIEAATFDGSKLHHSAAAAEAAEALRRCGAVFLRGYIPVRLAEAAHVAARAVLYNETRLHEHYVPLGSAAEETDKENLTGLPFKPNLRGGRYEVVPPSDDPALKTAVDAMASGVARQVLLHLWNSSEPELFVILLMAQARVAWDQPWHRDTNSFEEVNLQVALQDYGPEDGPPQFLLGSHKPAGLTHSMAQAIFRPVNRTPVRAGDAILYLSSVLHRGAENTGGRLQRLALDAVIHSTGRFQHDSEKLDLVRRHTRVSKHSAAHRAQWKEATAAAIAARSGAFSSTPAAESS